MFRSFFSRYIRQPVSNIVNAGVSPGSLQRNKRIRVINISSLIAASLVFFFGGGLTIWSGELAILYPAVPETAMFVTVILLNYRHKHFAAALLWHVTFCSATLIFGVMLSSVIDATHMAGYLIGAPLLIFKRDERKLVIACMVFSLAALVGIEINNNLKLFPPLEISDSLYGTFRIATWLTVILLNVVVILFYLQMNNQLIDSLKKTNAKLSKVNRKLAKASAYKTVYVNETTHELRGPLNALHAISQLLDDAEADKEDLHRMHQSIGYSVNHALEIINNVQELAKIEAGNALQPKIEKVPIRSWLHAAVSIYAYQASLNEVQVHVGIDPKMPDVISFSRVHVTQVLTNLISNAIKFTDKGKAIWISVNCDAEQWRIILRDEGIGMDDETLQKIFVPFYTGGHNNPQGTGLGLHIAKKLTERMGGALQAESKPGAGTKFTVCLPLRLETPPAAITAAPDPQSLPRPFDALVIDDDRFSAVYAKKLLEGMGCKVEVAATGELGFSMAQQSPPDVILLDLGLPGLRGPELLKKFKAHPALKNIPVVIVSGNVLSAEKDEVMQSGAAGYFVKPFDLAGMRTLLKNIGRPGTGGALALGRQPSA